MAILQRKEISLSVIGSNSVIFLSQMISSQVIMPPESGSEGFHLACSNTQGKAPEKTIIGSGIIIHITGLALENFSLQTPTS